MGSSTRKHRKESKKHKRVRSRSPSSDLERDRESRRRRHRQRRHKDADDSPSRSRSLNSSTRTREDRHHRHKHRRHKEHHHKGRHSREDIVVTVDNSDSDSSDCVEVPIDQELTTASKVVDGHTPARNSERDNRELGKGCETQVGEIRGQETRERELRDREREENDYELREKEREIARKRELEQEREREREYQRDRERHHKEVQKTRSHTPRREVEKKSDRSFSPIPENGAGDCLTIEATNKLRLKLGLKPLEVSSESTKPSTGSTSTEKQKSGQGLSSFKDEWGEFVHKPADNLRNKVETEKIREKLKQNKEKRALEEKLKRLKTLGESDDEVDDIEQWVSRNKQKDEMRKEAERRARALEEFETDFGVEETAEKMLKERKQRAYNDKHLRGLRVDHDMEDFSEGRTVILTLKDKGVLDDDDDALVNVNMIDDEHYRRNVINRKKNPLAYGYDVYEEQFDEFGAPIDRGILSKYDEELHGEKRKNFVIGENLDQERERKRRLLEIKTKLEGKRLETLDDARIQLASDIFSEAELAKFKKPKKKIKKLRQKVKADDLLQGAEPEEQHFGRRGYSHTDFDSDARMDTGGPQADVKPEIEEDDDLQRVLSKARKLKQKETLIKKPLSIEPSDIKSEIKEEPEDGSETPNGPREGHIVLNATAEFCRTLGDIPTYGMAGNRDEDSNDMMDFEVEDHTEEKKREIPEPSTGTWNSVNPEDVIRPMEDDIDDFGEVAILDEEPEVGAGVGNALKLALSKGYLEKDDKNRPSNSKLAYLQAKNYSIEDKTTGDDEKFGRRDRFHSGPIMEFRDKDNFKPNVKLEYIDDNGRVLNLKEAFRYLSHKFHGKGPGKNKIEKRLKKMEQDGLMKTMSSTDTPLGTLTMLQQKQKETKAPYVVLSGGKQSTMVSNTTISKYK